MKFLETRTEIAKAINFKQYPTIRIDVSKTDDYGIVGTHVLIDNGTFRTGEPYYVRATIRAFRDEGYLKFKSYGCCLHADFTIGWIARGNSVDNIKYPDSATQGNT